jgi:ABC-type dipeptide/oligopeptide/nickel transport system permease subunit
MMRFVDILYSLPSIVFVIVLITTVEGFFKHWLTQISWLNNVLSSNAEAPVRLLFLFAGLGAVSWLTMARIVRGQVLSLRKQSFVDASRALGASHMRILLRHILPNVFGIIIVYLTLTVPSVILYESFLSYLGLGIQAPQASLGSLIADGAAQINPIRVYWWTIIFPGGTLVLTLLALNFLGGGLRDAWDTRAERGA